MLEKTKLEVLSDLLDNLKDKTLSANSQIEELNQSVNAKVALEKQLKADLEISRINNEELTAFIESNKSKITEISLKNEDLSAKLKDEYVTSKKLSNDITELNKELTAQKNNFDVLINNYSELQFENKELKIFKTRFVEMKSENDSLKQSNNIYLEENSKLNSALSELDFLKKAFNDRNKDILDKGLGIDSLKEEMALLKNENYKYKKEYLQKETASKELYNKKLEQFYILQDDLEKVKVEFSQKENEFSRTLAILINTAKTNLNKIKHLDEEWFKQIEKSLTGNIVDDLNLINTVVFDYLSSDRGRERSDLAFDQMRLSLAQSKDIIDNQKNSIDEYKLQIAELTDNIRKQQNELSQSKSEINRFNSLLAERDDAYDALKFSHDIKLSETELQLKNNSKEINSLKENLEIEKNNNLSLQNECNSLKSDLLSNKASLQELNMEYSTLVHKYSSEKKQLVIEFQSLNNKIREYEKENQELKSNNDISNNDLDKLKLENENLILKSIGFEEQIKKYNDEIKGLNESIQESIQKNKDLEKSLNCAKTKVENELDVLKSSLITASNEIERLNNIKDETEEVLKDKINAFEIEKEEWNEILDIKDAEFTTYQTTINDYYLKNSRIEEELKEYYKKELNFEEVKKSLLIEIQSLKQQSFDFQTNNIELNNQLKEIQEKYDELINNCGGIDNEISDLNKELSELKENFANKEKEMLSTIESLAEKNRKLLGKKHLLFAENTLAYERQQEEINACYKDIFELNINAEDNRLKIEQLTAEIGKMKEMEALRLSENKKVIEEIEGFIEILEKY